VYPFDVSFILDVLMLRSLATYGFGFAVWNVDNLFCGDVRAVRNALPAVIRPLTQLHAWWHAAQLGTYMSILVLILLDDGLRLRLRCASGGPPSDALVLRYRWCGIVPVLEHTKSERVRL